VPGPNDRSTTWRSAPFAAPTLALGPLTAGASFHDGEITVRLIGEAAYLAGPPLEGFFAKIHQEADRLSVARVQVDLRVLMFMNSSCLKALTMWIHSVSLLPSDRRYRIVLQSKPTIHWQKRSLEAIRNLAPELVDLAT